MPFLCIKCRLNKALSTTSPQGRCRRRHTRGEATPGAPEAPQQTQHMPTPSPSRAPRAATPSDAPASYEAALEELEQLVAQLDAGQLPLDQLLTRYQRGAELLAFCRSRLEDVENQIKVLEGGTLKPWDSA